MVNRDSLGLFNSKSRKWWVSYNGSVSATFGVVAGGSYEFIFRGDDSLSAGVVTLTAVGAGLGFGAARAGRGRSGGVGRSQRQRMNDDEATELAELGEESINLQDAAADHSELAQNPSPWCDMQNASLKTARRPFSLNELNQAWGGIEVALDANAMVAGASILSINASMSVVSTYSEADPNTLFEGWNVYNTDDGSIGVQVYSVQGKWTVERYDDLMVNRCPIRSGAGLEHFYSTNPLLQDLD